MEKKYAFILGSGNLAESIVEKATAENMNFMVVGIKGSTPIKYRSYKSVWVKFGEAGLLLQKLKENNITHIVFAGAMKRPSLFSIKIDDIGKKVIKENFNKIGGDNSLLQVLINFFEAEGYKFIAPHEICPEILTKEKLYTSNSYLQENVIDIQNGFNVAKQIGSLDIGQSIIYQQNITVSVEGVEGTKNLIKRSKKIIKKKGPSAILVKVKKDNQTSKVDLPTIGPKTIKQCYCSGIKGIVIEAQNSIVLNEEETIKEANKRGIFLLGVNKNKLSDL